MLRLIEADLLKLRRRRGMLAVVAAIVTAAPVLYFTIGGKGGADGFSEAMGILTLLAAIPAAILGATAGGADIEAGVFRDLVATGRSRAALFFARVPAAWILTFGLLVIAIAISAAFAGAGLHPADAIGPLVSGALTAAVCVGLAALTGSRGPVMGLVLAFQLGVAPLLAQLDVLGDARWAIPSVALSRLTSHGGIVASLAPAAAVAILLAWTAAGLGAGLWRTRTQEI